MTMVCYKSAPPKKKNLTTHQHILCGYISVNQIFIIHPWVKSVYSTSPGIEPLTQQLPTHDLNPGPNCPAVSHKRKQCILF